MYIKITSFVPSVHGTLLPMYYMLLMMYLLGTRRALTHNLDVPIPNPDVLEPNREVHPTNPDVHSTSSGTLACTSQMSDVHGKVPPRHVRCTFNAW